MLRVEESIVIDKPRHEVFEFFRDAANVESYSSNLNDYRVYEGDPREEGRKARFQVRVVGLKLDFSDELVELVPDERARLESRDGRLSYAITMTFADEGAGTRVTWLQESEHFGGVFKLADGLVITMYSKDVRSNLGKAKDLIEG